MKEKDIINKIKILNNKITLLNNKIIKLYYDNDNDKENYKENLNIYTNKISDYLDNIIILNNIIDKNKYRNNMKVYDINKKCFIYLDDD